MSEGQTGSLGFKAWAEKKVLSVCKQLQLSDLLEQLWEFTEKFYFRGDILRARKALNLEELAFGGDVKTENLFEILYTCANEDIYNQFAFGSGKEAGTARIAADMVRMQFPKDSNDRRGVIKQIIELKTDVKSGDFYWASFEVIYYYFLMCRAVEKAPRQQAAAQFVARYRLAETVHLTVMASTKNFDTKETQKFRAALNTALRVRGENARISFDRVPDNFLSSDDGKIDAQILETVRAYEKCKFIDLELCKPKSQKHK